MSNQQSRGACVSSVPSTGKPDTENDKLVTLKFHWRGNRKDVDMKRDTKMSEIFKAIEGYLDIPIQEQKLIAKGYGLIKGSDKDSPLKAGDLEGKRITLMGLPRRELSQLWRETWAAKAERQQLDQLERELNQVTAHMQRRYRAAVAAVLVRPQHTDLRSPADIENPNRIQPKYEWQRRGFGVLAAPHKGLPSGILNSWIGINFLPRYQHGQQMCYRCCSRFVHEWFVIARQLLAHGLYCAQQLYKQNASRWARDMITDLEKEDLALLTEYYEFISVGDIGPLYDFFCQIVKDLKLDHIVIENHSSDECMEDIDSLYMLLDLLHGDDDFLNPNRRYRAIVRPKMRRGGPEEDDYSDEESDDEELEEGEIRE